MSEDGSAGCSRRAALTAGTGTLIASAAALAGCGSRHKKLRAPVPTQETPLVRRLLTALDLERQTIAAYAAGIPLLGHRGRLAAKRFLSLELSHAGEIGGLIEQAGVKPPKAGSVYDLGHPGGAHGVLAQLRDLEARQLALYLDLIPQVADGKTRAALSAVMGSDAQHAALLTDLLGEDPLSSALP